MWEGKKILFLQTNLSIYPRIPHLHMEILDSPTIVVKIVSVANKTFFQYHCLMASCGIFSNPPVLTAFLSKKSKSVPKYHS